MSSPYYQFCPWKAKTSPLYFLDLNLSLLRALITPHDHKHALVSISFGLSTVPGPLRQQLSTAQSWPLHSFISTTDFVEFCQPFARSHEIRIPGDKSWIVWQSLPSKIFPNFHLHSCNTSTSATMSSSDSNSPPPRTPHVRLNSSQSNMLTNESADNRPSSSRQDPTATRSLIPPPRPPTAPSIRNNPQTNKLYSGGIVDSSETLLLPPSRSRTHRFRDEESMPGSPVDTPSRRTSFGSSDGKGEHSKLYGLDPFADSRSPSRAGSDDETVNTQTVTEKYSILPSAGLLLFPEDVEKDDWLHNPDPNEKETRECNIFTKRGFVNIGGLALVTTGLLVLFIGYPIL